MNSVLPITNRRYGRLKICCAEQIPAKMAAATAAVEAKHVPSRGVLHYTPANLRLSEAAE